MSAHPWLHTHLDSLLGGSRQDELSSSPIALIYNQATGLGTYRDKTAYTTVNTAFKPLDVYTLSALYHGHDLAARIVDVVPEEELRLPFEVTVQGNEKAEKLLKEA